MLEPMADRKRVLMAAAALALQLRVQQGLREVLILLVVAAVVGVTLRRLVLVVLVVLPLVAVVVEHLPTGLIPVLVRLVVLALFASTLGKELT
jgi:hypothetical protein